MQQSHLGQTKHSSDSDSQGADRHIQPSTRWDGFAAPQSAGTSWVDATPQPPGHGGRRTLFGTNPEPGMSKVLLCVQELRGAGGAGDTWAVGAAAGAPTSAAGTAKPPVLHGARGVWSQVMMPEQPGAGCQGVPKGVCVLCMEGQDPCTLQGLQSPVAVY